MTHVVFAVPHVLLVWGVSKSRIDAGANIPSLVATSLITGCNVSSQQRETFPRPPCHRGVKCSVTQTPLTCEDTHVHTQIHHTLFMQKVWCERVDGEIVLFGKVETVRWCHAIVVQEYTPCLLLVHYSVQAQWTYFHLRGQRIGGWVVQDPSGSHIWCQSQYPTTSSIARLSSYSMHWRPSNALKCRVH